METIMNDKQSYYFEDPEETARLMMIIEGWAGTPYRHYCGVKGLGCDCVHFIKAVEVEMGLCADFKIPFYERGWPLHRHEGLVRSMIEKHLDVVEIPKGADLMAGDILLYRWGKDASHAGICLAGSVWMSTRRHGVENVDPTQSNWTKRHQITLRVVR